MTARASPAPATRAPGTIPRVLLERWRCQHCHMAPLHDRALDALQALARLIESAPAQTTLTSGYRCPTHNARTPGAATNSLHLTGLAADLTTAAAHLDALALHAKHHQWTVRRSAGATGRPFLHVEFLSPPQAQ